MGIYHEVQISCHNSQRGPLWGVYQEFWTFLLCSIFIDRHSPWVYSVPTTFEVPRAKITTKPNNAFLQIMQKSRWLWMFPLSSSWRHVRWTTPCIVIHYHPHDSFLSSQFIIHNSELTYHYLFFSHKPKKDTLKHICQIKALYFQTSK